MIILRQISKVYGMRPILRGVDLVVAKGERLVLFGPNGAGKTTLLRITAGLTRPTTGAGTVGGWPLSTHAGAVRSLIGVVSHHTLLYDELSAEENLRLYAYLYGLRTQGAAERIAEVLEMTGLYQRSADVVRTFSRGMQQRLAIARALLHRPSVMLLDEPYTGLDQQAASRLDSMLSTMAEAGCTILLTTHDIPHGLSVADRVAVLADGHIVHYGSADSFDTHALTDLYASPALPPVEVDVSANRTVSFVPLPAMPGLMQAAQAIAAKDIRAEWRSRETLLGMLVFALLAVLIFSFALEFDRTGRQASAAGVTWVTLVFATTLGLGRSMGQERDKANLDGLLLAPIDRNAIFLGKMASSLLGMLILSCLLVPFVSVLFNVSFLSPFVPVVFLLGTLGYAGVGTVIATIAAFSRGRELLLPVLLLPIALSILIPSVRATRDILQGVALAELSPWFNLLIATNVIYLALAYMLFDFVVEE